MLFFRIFCSEEFLQFIIKASVVNLIFNKSSCFQYILWNNFRQMHLKYEDYSLRRVFFLDNKTILRIQKPQGKNFHRNTVKIKAGSPAKSNQTNKQAKNKQTNKSNVSSSVSIGLTLWFGGSLFCVPIGRARKIARSKIRASRTKFVYPCEGST